ncbi:MAG: RNA-binding protein [Sphingobacteriales bacterium]|nr:MAG: RNA-binding protein [Sphingobacteriales bacterium]
MKIFVGNLSVQTTGKQLQDLFSKYGEPELVTIMADRITRRSRGFAYVEMADDAQAGKAIDQLHNTMLDGRSIVVNDAKGRS